MNGTIAELLLMLCEAVKWNNLIFHLLLPLTAWITVIQNNNSIKTLLRENNLTIT